MSNADIFFFDPGMTDIDSIIFGPDEIAIELKCSNALDDFWAICSKKYLSEEYAFDFLHALFAYRNCSVEHFNVYTEDEFRDMWNGADDE